MAFSQIKDRLTIWCMKNFIARVRHIAPIKMHQIMIVIYNQDKRPASYRHAYAQRKLRIIFLDGKGAALHG